MKKLLAALAVAALIAGAFFALSLSKKKEAWRPGIPLAQEHMKVCVIHISNVEKMTSGYAHAHEIGIREAQKKIGLSDKQIIRKANVSDIDFLANEHVMRECIAEGAKIIIATSWNHMPVCAKLAGEYPGVVFAHASGMQHNETNFTNYFGRIYQPRYLSGIAAGLRSATNKIGYVAAMGKDNSEVTGGINAFALGVESVNREAKVYVKVLHRWFDPAGEEEAARSLINKGCDVIAQHSDSPRPQLAAQEGGKWGIGYNSDMQGDAPRAVIASVVWNWGVYYTRLIRSVIEGSFTTKPYLGDLADGMVALTPPEASLLPPGALEAIAAARKRLESGEFDVFEGTMETNEGRTVGEQGRRLSDVEILRGMDWYCRNVVEVH